MCRTKDEVDRNPLTICVRVKLLGIEESTMARECGGVGRYDFLPEG